MKTNRKDYRAPTFVVWRKEDNLRRISFSLLWRCRNICVRIFSDFARSFWDFSRIFDNSKLWGAREPPAPTPLLPQLTAANCHRINMA